MAEENQKKQFDDLWHPGAYIKEISPTEVEKLKETLDKAHNENMNFNCKKCDKKISAHNKDWHDCMCDKCFNETYFPDETQTKKKVEKVFMKPGRNNQEDRINFVKFWANYIKTHSDKEWSEQQNILIDGQFSGT